MMLGWIEIDPGQKITDIAFGVCRSTGCLMPDAHKDFDTHFLELDCRWYGTFDICEVNAIFIAIGSITL